MEVKVKPLSRVWLFVTPWTVAHQGPPSMGFSRQEYWSALPFPPPGDLPDPGIEPGSPALQADALRSEPPGKPLVSVYMLMFIIIIKPTHSIVGQKSHPLPLTHSFTASSSPAIYAFECVLQWNPLKIFIFLFVVIKLTHLLINVNLAQVIWEKILVFKGKKSF